MTAEVTIGIDDAFNSLNYMEQAEVYEQGYNDAVEEFKTKSNGIQRKDP